MSDYSSDEDESSESEVDEEERRARELSRYIVKAKELFVFLYSECPLQMGKDLSRMERERRDLTDSNLVYGECQYESLGAVFSRIKAKGYMLDQPGGNFYDLGSGLGKAVFTAVLMHDFHKCVGFEFLEQLATSSQDVVKRWKMACKEDDTFLPREKQYCDIRFAAEDILTANWRDADVLFISATCFNEKVQIPTPPCLPCHSLFPQCSAVHERN